MCHWPVGIRVVIYLVLAFVIFWASLDAGADLRRAQRPFSAVGAIFGLAVPAFLMMCARAGALA